MENLDLLCEACLDGNLQRVKALATEDNINIKNRHEISPIIAAILEHRVEIVKYLLRFPNIDPNIVYLGAPALLIAYRSAPYAPISNPIVKMLLNDPRVDINVPDNHGKTLIWYAVHDEQFDGVKRILFNPKFVDTTIGGSSLQFDELFARRTNRARIFQLIKAYREDPNKVRKSLWTELNVFPSPLIYASIVFVSDGLLQLKRPPNADEPHGAREFFSVGSRLPLELQMVLSNRSHRQTKDFIPANRSEAAFRELAESLMDD